MKEKEKKETTHIEEVGINVHPGDAHVWTKDEEYMHAYSKRGLWRLIYNII